MLGFGFGLFPSESGAVIQESISLSVVSSLDPSSNANTAAILSFPASADVAASSILGSEMGNVEFLIDGIDRAKLHVLLKSLEVRKRGNNETLKATIFDKEGGIGAYRPQIGDEVRVSMGGYLIFGGRISSARDKTNGPSPALTEIECRDWTELTDEAIVNIVWPPSTLHAVANGLFQAFLAPKGVSMVGPTSGGPALTSITWDHQTVRTAYDHLSKQTGGQWQWRITGDRDFFFGQLGSDFAVHSPLNVGNARVLEPMEWTANKAIKANVVYLRTGGSGDMAYTDTHTGNGVRTIFPLVVEPSAGALPTQVTETFGGVPTVHQFGDGVWSYIPNLNGIQRVSPLSNGATVDVTYTVTLPVWIRQIHDTARLSGGDINRAIAVERTVQGAELVDINQAKAVAAGYLDFRLVSADQVVKVETFTHSWYPWLMVTLDFPSRGVQGDYLIQEVRIQDVGLKPDTGLNRLKHVLTCRKAPLVGRTSVDFWRDTLLGGGGGGSSLIGAPVPGTTTPGGGASRTVWIGSTSRSQGGVGRQWPIGFANIPLNGSEYPIGAVVVLLARLRLAGQATVYLRNTTDATDAGQVVVTSTGQTEQQFAVTLPNDWKSYRIEYQIDSPSGNQIEIDYAYVWRL